MKDDDETLLELLTKKSNKRMAKKEVSKSKYTTTGSNNWMNIRHSKNQKWLGEVGNSGGFVVFEKPEYSIRAFYKVLNSYSKQGVNTLNSIANKYAPKEDGNNPSTYVKLATDLLRKAGYTVDGSTVIDASLYPYLAKVFLKIEAGIDKDVNWFETILKTYL